MRALFDYDPSNDELLPCKEIGLSFSSGDILQISTLKIQIGGKQNMPEPKVQ